MGRRCSEVQRANMLLGDIGETLRLAAMDGSARPACGCSILSASCWPVRRTSAEEALSYFENALVEDKYDGIRAQAHVSGDEVRIFSRTRDEITESFSTRDESLLPRIAGRTGRAAGRRDSRRRNRGLELSTRTNAGRALPFMRSATASWDERRSASNLCGKCRSLIWRSMSSMPSGELLIDRPLQRAGKSSRRTTGGRASSQPATRRTVWTSRASWHFGSEELMPSAQRTITGAGISRFVRPRTRSALRSRPGTRQ